jgi:hypothetical protein
MSDYQRQYDDPALLAASTYRGRFYDSARDYVVKPLLENLEAYGPGLIVAADTSIWEQRQKDNKRFAFSTAAAIVGLRHFCEAGRPRHRGGRRPRCRMAPTPTDPAADHDSLGADRTAADRRVQSQGAKGSSPSTFSQ